MSPSSKSQNVSPISETLTSETGDNTSAPILDQNELALIESLFNTHQYEKLEERLTNLLQYNPSAVFLYNMLGLSQVGLGKFNEALINYQKVLATQPNHASVYYNMGMAYLNMGNFEAAIESYKKAAQLDPAIKGVNKHIGVCFNNLQQYEEAIQHYKKALEDNPSDFELHRNIGIASDNLRQPEIAINHYLSALRNNPDDISTYNRLGSTFLSVNRTVEAIKVLEQAIIIAPENYELHINLGLAYSKQDKHQEAINFFILATKLETDTPNAYVRLGTIMQYLGRYDEALFYLDHAQELDDSDPEIYCLKGTTYLKSGFIQSSMECFQRALQLEPNHVDALYLLSICFNDDGQHKQAITLLEHAISLSANDASLYSQLGNSYLGLYQLHTAISHFNNALKINPNLVEALIGLGDCYRKTGTPHAALEQYQRTLELQPNSIIALTKFSEVISELDKFKVTPTLRKHIKNCFLNPNIYSSKVSAAANFIIKRDLSDFNETDNLSTVTLENLDQISNGLLFAYLKSYNINDPDIINMLTGVRARMLELLNTPEISIPSTSNLFKQLEAFAFQGYKNSYKWHVTDSENVILSLILERTCQNLQQGQPPEVSDLMILASYQPLNTICEIKEWALVAYENCTQDLKPLLELHIIQPERQLILAESIPKLTETKNDLTDNYSPYSCHLDGIPAYNPTKYTQHIRHMIAPYQSEIPATTENPQILIVCCNSGKTAITAAQTYRKGDIFAIDQSLENLAYGKRVTCENMINNISFFQADILKLNNWNKKFEVIECYKIDDLRTILPNLLQLLTPGGYLKLSISQLHTPQLQNTHTISETLGILQTYSLNFLGLEIDDLQIKLSYQQMFPEDQDCISAENWDEFEILNPSTFADDYIIWCRKH